ncbi:uncharacterized protein myripa [Aulostomus maculatus]
MGRKLDLSGLSDNEAQHVLQVVQRDMRLRKKEEERLSELKQELDEEGSRCLLLSRQSCFNQRCCIRCCAPFTFLLNPKRQCRDCLYNVCKACRVYNKQDKAWLCSACQKSRLLKTQSLEWFYANVKRRFKRFGSAKVLKTLYRKHLAEHSALSELTEGSAYEESICNEGSVCGSDSTFYRQTEEHSMAETLTVALRVAEEAIDEAISNAEFDTASQEKQNEARYLREHRQELVEELSKTIVQKIMTRRRTLAEMKEEYDQGWSLEHHADLHHHRQSAGNQTSRALKHRRGLWRSHSAFSLLDNDPPGLIQGTPQALKKEDDCSVMPSRKSVDRLENSVSSVLKSPDGNWIALQSAQLSRPSLLTKRKSLVYSALERESGVVSAYEGMDSDDDTKPELHSSWGAVLQKIHKKMTDSKPILHDTGDVSPQPTDHRDGRDDLFSDSDGNWKSKKSQLALFKRKVPAEIRRPSSSRRTNIIDVNFNVRGAEEESSFISEPDVGKLKRSRKKRRSKRRPTTSSPVLDYNEKDDQSDHPSDAATPDTLTSGTTTPDLLKSDSDITGHAANQIDWDLTLKLQQLASRVSDSSSRDNGLNEARDADSDDAPSEEGRQENSDDERMEIDLAEGRTEDEKEEEEEDDEEMRDRLYRLVAQSRLTYFSSTDDELDRVDATEGQWDRQQDEDKAEEYNQQNEDTREGLTYKLCQLESEVRATQFSSTEDELDKITDEEKKTGREEEGQDEELAVTVCRLAHQISATQFSSTEDELDRVGRDEVMDEETLWKLQEEEATPAAQVRNLASLVSTSQFSSTEDEMYRYGEDESELQEEANEGGVEGSSEMEGASQRRRESMADLDVNMFDLREDIEERFTEEKTEIMMENIPDYLTVFQVQQAKMKIKHSESKDWVEESETKNEMMVEKVLEVTAKRQEMEEEGTEKITALENQPEPKNEEDERWEPDKFRERKRSQGEWGMASDSDEDDVEFHRIISSMLMMTLEDMQGDTVQEENGGVKRELEDVKTDKEVKEESSSANSSQCGGDNGRPQTDVTQQTRGEISWRVESGGALTGGTKTSRQEKDPDSLERPSAEQNPTDMTIKETNEVRQTCKRAAVEDENGRGKMASECQTETRGSDAGGERGGKETDETTEKHADDTTLGSSSSLPEGFLSPEEIQNRYSAASLRSITTEVLKVLNATEELLQGVKEADGPQPPSASLPPNTDPKTLDQQFSRLEENVYVAAGSVYHLEAELSDLEECARGICSTTSDMELYFLEEQVASAAAKVQQSELQISDISARIAALRSAGLNVDLQSPLTKTRTTPVMPLTLDSSRQHRRRLPAPPVKEDKET